MTHSGSGEVTHLDSTLHCAAIFRDASGVSRRVHDTMYRIQQLAPTVSDIMQPRIWRGIVHIPNSTKSSG